MSYKTYNITDIANMANVSVSSVSRYFTDTGQMRVGTKTRIAKVVNKTGFYPNVNARALGKLNGHKKRR